MRKITGRIMSGMVLSLSLLFASPGIIPVKLPVPYAMVSVEAAAVGLNQTKASVFVGKTTVLRVKGTKAKVTFQSANKKVASVTAKGVVKGVTAGKTVITATANKKSYKCTVTVKNQLSTPKINLVCSKDRSITISYAGKEDASLDFKIADPTVVDCEWGDWNNSGTRIPLKIVPRSAGKTKVTVILSNTKEKLVFTVTVPKSYSDPDRELTGRQIYSKCAPATAEVITYDSRGLGINLGTGFFIDNGVLVTNFHVIEGSSSIQINMNDNKVYEVEKVLGYDKTKDIAVLKVNSTKNAYLTVSGRGIYTGDTIYALGSSEGLTGTFSSGIVSSASRTIEKTNYIQISAPISQGNSGGPLLNIYGEVVGINTMGYKEGENLNFAVNIAELKKIDLSHPRSIVAVTGGDSSLDINEIKEDSSKSAAKSTAQVLKNKDMLTGSLIDGSSSDYYRFELETTSNMILFVGTEKDADYKHMKIELMDESGKVVYAPDMEKESGIIVISEMLKSGNYYLSIQRNTNEREKIEYFLGVSIE